MRAQVELFSQLPRKEDLGNPNVFALHGAKERGQGDEDPLFRRAIPSLTLKLLE